jgi:preprotein translocase subunit SecA
MAMRGAILQTLDMLWVEHLESMEYLRGSVNLRAYGQRDPLTEYRKEGTRIYKEMELMLAERVYQVLEALTKEVTQQAASLGETVPAPGNVMELVAAAGGPLGDIGRNDPCPCGSGKKWKNCGMKNTEEHQQRVAAKVK